MAHDPENYRIVEANIGERKIALHAGNVGLAFFRQEQAKNFIEHTNEDNEVYWIFNNHGLMLWMNGAPIVEDDQELLDQWNETNGQFTELSGGWRPQASIEDTAPPHVTETYIEFSLKDLNQADTPPEGWS